MAQRNRHRHLLGARLSQWQAVLLLCLFLSVRGLMPAGYMPAPMATGSLFGLCHGDSRSTALLQSLARLHAQHGHHPHNGHQHDALTAHTFADNHCNFSTGANLATAQALDLSAIATGAQPVPGARYTRFPVKLEHLLPPPRGPPASRSA
ncbi:hypothetical protein [Microbulbifer thermotolerans]|uniref:DUF2946 domain-containing protein n=1 Tax=Microbulbifer thermotolerans TaxID=252514 RepID=A0A143HQG9_MICTH|nr:hypothetical protein [Microbulbifer thermotolerans]AMX03746.1 hypothetical protein A3224_15160 [Microbulbifer thermotolerans]MCX2780685.1 hypothetical protein [Microbulbifer thermotolerans]MCX2783589.1 hypothetical protein [Microbulbifer thermotolerans]MCX2801964.1 hypothetical protein [Microbulbifer thermotolerans]MCX2806327.1 hypothetical protein [Microbulbifer thermotolerans]